MKRATLERRKRWYRGEEHPNRPGCRPQPVCRRGHPKSGVTHAERRCAICVRIRAAKKVGRAVDAEGYALVGSRRPGAPRAPRRYVQSLDLIDNAMLREAVLGAVAKGMTWGEIARRAGIIAARGKADTTRLQRIIGHREYVANKKGKRYVGVQVRCLYDTAVRIMRAIGADPFEVGL